MGPTAHHRALHNLLNRRTEQQMVLAASTKFGGSDRYQLAEWRYIATVVTDRTPPQSFRASLKRSSTRIVLSDGRGRPQGGNVG
jgi:DeoR/GlpR family transcriptional regulator of sugar metabolism